MLGFGFGELGVECSPVQLVPYPAVNSKQFLPGLFLQEKEGGWRARMASVNALGTL